MQKGTPLMNRQITYLSFIPCCSGNDRGICVLLRGPDIKSRSFSNTMVSRLLLVPDGGVHDDDVDGFRCGTFCLGCCTEQTLGQPL